MLQSHAKTILIPDIRGSGAAQSGTINDFLGYHEFLPNLLLLWQGTLPIIVRALAAATVSAHIPSWGSSKTAHRRVRAYW
jgi:hypothetical protein